MDMRAQIAASGPREAGVPPRGWLVVALFFGLILAPAATQLAQLGAAPGQEVGDDLLFGVAVPAPVEHAEVEVGGDLAESAGVAGALDGLGEAVQAGAGGGGFVGGSPSAVMIAVAVSSWR